MSIDARAIDKTPAWVLLDGGPGDVELSPEMLRAAADCPHGEPLHYHHYGCPACSFDPPLDGELQDHLEPLNNNDLSLKKPFLKITPPSQPSVWRRFLRWLGGGN